MNNNNNILNELQQISQAVATIEQVTPYNVPSGYFEGLADSIVAQVRLASLKEAGALPQYVVPDAYFDNLPSQILQKVKEAELLQTPFEELEAHATLLNTVSKEMPYKVPVNYFDNLPSIITSRQTRSKVVSLSRQWFAYLSAAVVAGIMVTGAYMFTDSSRQSSDDFGSFKTSGSVDVKESVSKLSEDDIVNYLSAHPPISDPSQATENSVEPDIQNSINSMTEEEIQQYLKETNDLGDKSVNGI